MGGGPRTDSRRQCLVCGERDDLRESVFDAATARRLLSQALHFGRLNESAHDPRECVACGKAWPTIDLAVECCEPMGVARCLVLDDAEDRERQGSAPEGSTAMIDAELSTPGHPRRDQCLAAFGRVTPHMGYGPMRRFVIAWQAEMRGEFDRSDTSEDDLRRRDQARWNRDFRRRKRERSRVSTDQASGAASGFLKWRKGLPEVEA